MLQDDRHFLRPLFREPARDFDAGRVGAEGDREMMFAGQFAQRGDFPQDLADDAAHGVLYEQIVSNEVIVHVVAYNFQPGRASR